jgi:hypothetical protein
VPAPPKKLGRPRRDAADRSVKVTINVSSKCFDALCAQAYRQDVSLPEVIRRQLYGVEKRAKP